MKLEDIGFYTLYEDRAKTSSINSDIIRAELLLTDSCNLSCVYCRGMTKYLRGNMPLSYAQDCIQNLVNNGLQNIRFSGGEPTLYPYIKALVRGAKKCGIKRIAISTNGTASIKKYADLITLGVSDFSVSLDAGCCSINTLMNGGNKDAFKHVSEVIAFLSKYVYTTVGIVFNELNYKYAKKTIQYIDSLQFVPKDIRIISSAQYNKALPFLKDVPIKEHPILKYRINNFIEGKSIRGITKTDCHKCYLVLDDIAIAGKYQFPCIIYLRENGNSISIMNENFRYKRLKWFENHNSYKDNICRNNCLDVCVDYNNKCYGYKSS